VLLVRALVLVDPLCNGHPMAVLQVPFSDPDILLTPVLDDVLLCIGIPKDSLHSRCFPPLFLVGLIGIAVAGFATFSW
jgi:hypothetical protein